MNAAAQPGARTASWHRARASQQACALAALTALLLPACVPELPPLAPPAAPLPEVVARVNANNERINAVYAARCALAGVLTDENGRARRVDLQGPLRYAKPRQLYLDLQAFGGLAGAARIGSNPLRYWLAINGGELDKFVWGKYEHLDESDVREFPLRPDLLIEALGVNPLPRARGGLLEPVRQTSSEYDELIYLRFTHDGRLVIDREYYIDRRPPFLIRRIVLRDAAGAEAMVARLSNYKPVGGNGPLTAKTIELSWPQQQATLELKLWARKLMVWDAPRREKVFAFPIRLMASHDRVTQIDAHHDEPTTAPAGQ